MDREPEKILKTDSLGRVRTSPERREAILDDFEQSGMSGVAYARRQGINYQTFATWIQKRKRSRGGVDQGRSKAKRSASKKPAKMELTLAEVSVAKPDEKKTTGGLRVEVPGGAVVVIEEPAQAELAAALIRQLASD